MWQKNRYNFRYTKPAHAIKAIKWRIWWGAEKSKWKISKLNIDARDNTCVLCAMCMRTHANICKLNFKARRMAKVKENTLDFNTNLPLDLYGLVLWLFNGPKIFSLCICWIIWMVSQQQCPHLSSLLRFVRTCIFYWE